MKARLPNALTIIRMFLIPVFVAFYLIGIQNWQLYAGIIFIIASFTDWLDGFLARRWNQISNFGKFMDPIADKLLVLAALLVLMDCDIIPLWAVIVLIAREFIISGFRLVAASQNIVIAADMSGKIKTAVQMIAIILLLVGQYIFGDIAFFIGMIFIYISVALSIYSCIECIVKNKMVFSNSREEN